MRSLDAWDHPGRRGPARRARGVDDVIVLGTGWRARRVAAQLEGSRRARARVVGFLDDEPLEIDRQTVGERYLGRLERLADLVPRLRVSRVVLALPRQFLARESVANAIGLCEMLGIDFTIAADIFDTRRARVVPGGIPGLPALTLSVHRHHRPWKLAIKRTVDVAVSLAALALTLPLWGIIALAIKLGSPGPVFFVQERCGLHGRPFPFLKFRTMHSDAEQRLAEVRRHNEQSGPVFKMRDDPRITPVGRVLRKFSLDELPQLLHVLAGQMSLVGPRPPIPAEVESYEADHRGRLSMRPGITCLWQVSGRNQIPFEDWVKLDLEYVERWSLTLDAEILLATIPAVLLGRGAS